MAEERYTLTIKFKPDVGYEDVANVEAIMRGDTSVESVHLGSFEPEPNRGGYLSDAWGTPPDHGRSSA